MAVLQQVSVPLLSVNDTMLTISEISFVNGYQVKKGDLLMVFETSKTTFDVYSEVDGFIQYNCVPGNEYEVNVVVGIVYSTLEETEQKVQEQVFDALSLNVEVNSKVEMWSGDTIFSKKALLLKVEYQLGDNLFRGRDFINEDDLNKILAKKNKQPNPVVKSLDRNQPKIYDFNEDLVELVKLSSSKRKEIEYLSDVQVTGLTSTVNIYIETEGIFHWYNQSLRYFKDSLLPMIVYECARLLKKYPHFNAYYNNDHVAIYKAVNIGFAIDIDKGLKVVRIPLAGESSLNFIEDQIMLLSGKYVDDNLDIADLTNISFTITDLSSEGILSFRPLVNRMNSAILGISAIDKRLQRCILSLTFDHRVTEGKEASRFLSELKERMESYRVNDISYIIDKIFCYKCLKQVKEDLGDVGFIKCITPKGKEAYICQSCLNGF